MDYIAFGENLRLLRESVGLTQDELAHRLGKTQKTISKIETGSQRIFLDDLFHFSEVLKVPVPALLSGQLELDDLDELIIAEVHKLPTIEARHALLKVIQAFSELVQTTQRE